MIRRSSHTVKFTNHNKKDVLASFLSEYQRVASIFLDYMWDNEIKWVSKSKVRILDIKNNQLDCPQFISTCGIPIETTLSARAQKCCITQVCGLIKARTEKQRKKLYVLAKLIKENKNTDSLKKIIANVVLTKPNIDVMKAELNSICIDTKEVEGEFDAFIQLKALGDAFGKIRIPIKHHRHSRKLQQQGTRLASFLISSNSIDIRWKSPDVLERKEGIVVGADQGLTTVLTFSNGTVTSLTNKDGYSLHSITTSLARKQKGSKSFERTQRHRENFINWSINQLNLNGIRQINLEKVINIRKGRRSSRLMSHWSNPLIRNKLKKLCEEHGVRVVEQSSVYRSQRCSNCGLVLKQNRKSKEYHCKACGLHIDADLNAARNHAVDIPEIPFAFSKLKLNRVGFFWKESGLYDLTGSELTVPISKVKEN